MAVEKRRLPRTRAPWRVLAGMCLALGVLASPASAAERARRFVIEQNPFVLGQAMDWLDRTHVVWHDATIRDEDGDGQTHIYSSTLDGADKRCLTCGLPGRHEVPVVQPKGEWIRAGDRPVRADAPLEPRADTLQAWRHPPPHDLG